MSLGLLHIRNVLEPQLCAEICEHMPAVAGRRAQVRQDGGLRVDEQVRRVTQKTPARDFAESVSQALERVRPQIENAFGFELSPPGVPRFLSYGRGDYFRKHLDTTGEGEASAEIRSRVVSAVILLNDHRPDSPMAGYTGGRLVLYDVEGLSHRVVIEPETGLLVAFPSTTLHEVTRIRSGTRMSIVAWYHGDLER